MAQPSAFAIILAGILLLAGCTAAPATNQPEPQNVHVEYINPEKFTDVGDSPFPSDASRASHLEQLRKYLARRASTRLTAGQKLTVFITDVDMAGNFESVRVRSGSTRVIRDIYPPRINLHFLLKNDKNTDAGAVKEGARQLRNSAFLTTLQAYRSDPLRYEKELLDDWLDREFPPHRG